MHVAIRPRFCVIHSLIKLIVTCGRRRRGVLRKFWDPFSFGQVWYEAFASVKIQRLAGIDRRLGHHGGGRRFRLLTRREVRALN